MNELSEQILEIQEETKNLEEYADTVRKIDQDLSARTVLRELIFPLIQKHYGSEEVDKWSPAELLEICDRVIDRNKKKKKITAKRVLAQIGKAAATIVVIGAGVTLGLKISEKLSLVEEPIESEAESAGKSPFSDTTPANVLPISSKRKARVVDPFDRTAG